MKKLWPTFSLYLSLLPVKLPQCRSQTKINTMILQDNSTRPGRSGKFRYIMLAITGVMIMVLCGSFQDEPLPAGGEYFYSNFFRNNFKLPAQVLFIIAGFIAGYVYRLNPLLTGFSLFLFFPLTAILEMINYKGSHNLVPMEFVMFFLYAIPSIIAAFLGKRMHKGTANNDHSGQPGSARKK
jgi:hypothetical protein